MEWEERKINSYYIRYRGSGYKLTAYPYRLIARLKELAVNKVSFTL